MMAYARLLYYYSTVVEICKPGRGPENEVEDGREPWIAFLPPVSLSQDERQIDARIAGLADPEGDALDRDLLYAPILT
jgi:hypothetical protein